MARFQFGLSRLVGRAARAGVVVSPRTLHSLQRQRVVRDTTARGLASPGPGWFDSSWELVRGLDVREGPPGDQCLHEWLEACLRGEPAGSSTAAERDEQPGACLVPPAPHRAFVDALQVGDLDLAVPAEVTHLDEFGQIGIDDLQLA